MKLYLYYADTGVLFDTVDAAAWDSESYTTPQGDTVYIGREIEFSALADCSQRLRFGSADASGIYDALAAAYSEGVQQA